MPEACWTPLRASILNLTIQSDVHHPRRLWLLLRLRRRIPWFTIHFSQHLPVPALLLWAPPDGSTPADSGKMYPRCVRLTSGSFPATDPGSIGRPTSACPQLSGDLRSVQPQQTLPPVLGTVVREGSHMGSSHLTQPRTVPHQKWQHLVVQSHRFPVVLFKP